MLSDLIAHLAKTNGLADPIARQALGIILNGADRQDAPLAAAVFCKIPGSRALAARTGSEIGAPVGEIARLIEKTPGGRRCVVQSMLSALHAAGLGHDEIAGLLPAIGGYMDTVFGIEGLGHLGDLITVDATAREALADAA
jgi:hypothetical protein